MKFQFSLRWFAYGVTKSSVSAAEFNLELKPQANNFRISQVLEGTKNLDSEGLVEI